MNRWKIRSLLMLAFLTCLLLGLTRPAAGQATAKLEGDVLDKDAKPFVGVAVTIKSDMGQNYQLTTDAKGHFIQTGMRSGTYVLTFKYKEQSFHEIELHLNTGQEQKVLVNVKELLAKQDVAMAEKRKKEQEEQGKFEGMKEHFDLGVTSINQAKQLSAEIQRAPADQRDALKQKQAALQQTAVTEFQAAEKAADPKEANLHVILSNLGSAYLSTNKFLEAADAYQRAIALKPQPSYFVDLATALAKGGKPDEAKATCERIPANETSNAATCWRNLGIVHYQKSEHTLALEPLKKATQLDPSNAQAWYVLGASLVATMGFKQEGDKTIPIMQPGTIEAYQKCIELDPNGTFGAQAQAGLKELEALGLGITTKVKVRGKKN